MSGKRATAWAPQAGPQKALIDCPLPEVFFGGARGGGKTDGVLGKYAIKAGRYGSHFNALFCRRELPMLDDAIERSREIFGRIGASFNEQKKEWRFPGNGRLRFRPLERVQDADKYQGQNVTDACIEEAGIYPDPRPIDRLRGVLRSAHGVPTQLILTGNPGGAGQSWIKQRYIDPWPAGMRVLKRVLPNGAAHRSVFIPSRIQDNRLLLANDPNYINNLYLVGSDQLVQAWLDGDWNAVEGAFFDCWSSEKHVIPPFEIPDEWARIRSCDWGSARPFSVGWWAVVGNDLRHPTRNVLLPRGALVRYREWYGSNGDPNVGLKLTAEEVARGVFEREGAEFDERGTMLKKPTEKIDDSVIDPATFAEDGGPSIRERMGTSVGLWWRAADNKRVARNGAMGGWDMMRARFKGDERPMIYCFSTCVDSIRTIPVLQHDKTKAEDLDTESEDHAADDWRYACMSRPWTKPIQTPGYGPKPSDYVAYQSVPHDNDAMIA
jgi:hypothetical protein